MMTIGAQIKVHSKMQFQEAREWQKRNKKTDKKYSDNTKNVQRVTVKSIKKEYRDTNGY